MVEQQLFTLVSAGFGALASVLLSLLLLEQRNLRQRVGQIERSSARVAVYLSLLCDKAGISFDHSLGE